MTIIKYQNEIIAQITGGESKTVYELLNLVWGLEKCGDCEADQETLAMLEREGFPGIFYSEQGDGFYFIDFDNITCENI